MEDKQNVYKESLKTTAELRVVQKYHKLYKPLIDLVDTLQRIEPGGTLVDDVTFSNKTDEHGESKVRIAYVARPVMMTIKDGNRTFILRVLEEPNDQ